MKWKKSKQRDEPKNKNQKKPEWLKQNLYDTEEDWYDACQRDYGLQNERYEDEYLDGWDIKG